MSLAKQLGRGALFALTAVTIPCISGCTPDPPDPAKVYLASTMVPAPGGGALCGVNSSIWINIGTDTASVEDGSSFEGRAVGVSCEVTPVADGFNVNATGKIAGTGGGSVVITGKFTSTGEQKGVRAVFQRSDLGRWESSDCTVNYTNKDMGVAGGRVWGELKCPTIQNLQQNVGDPPQPRSCQGTAEFKFENCQQ
jgi:hypothetical protein